MRIHSAPTAFLFLVTLIVPPLAHAQTDERRVSAGAQLTTLQVSDGGRTNAGIGGRVSYDLSHWIAIDGELNLFGNDVFESRSMPAFVTDLRVRYDRRRLEGFAGPRVGVRFSRFGIFGKARPGFTRLFDDGVRCIGDDCARILMLLALPEYRTEFALDLGGIVEFYPSSRMLLRVDVGSTLIRHRSFAPPCSDCTTGNFSSRIRARSLS